MRRLMRSWRARVAVAGHSMEPTLRDGDWLLVDPAVPPAAGRLAVVSLPERWLVKRVRRIDADGSLLVAGDHVAHRASSQRVAASVYRGRPWLRYWPPGRIGRVG